VADENAGAQAESISQIARNMAAQISIRNSAQAGEPTLDIQLMQ
jgi:hypothetical protein